MFIRYYMTANPVTITVDTPLMAVRELLDKHHFRHLPVVDAMGVLLGMITDRDIRSASPSTVLPDRERKGIMERVQMTPAGEIMSRNFISLKYSATLDDAVLLFRERNIGALPVCQGGRVVGILSQTDLMQAFGHLFGLGDKGSALLSIEVTDTTPELSRLVQVLEEQRIPFTRLVRCPGSDQEPAMIYLRINTFKLPAVHRAVEEAGFSLRRETDGEIRS